MWQPARVTTNSELPDTSRTSRRAIASNDFEAVIPYLASGIETGDSMRGSAAYVLGKNGVAGAESELLEMILTASGGTRSSCRSDRVVREGPVLGAFGSTRPSHISEAS